MVYVSIYYTGVGLVRIPTVSKAPLDLFMAFSSVQNLGGFVNVSVVYMYVQPHVQVSVHLTCGIISIECVLCKSHHHVYTQQYITPQSAHQLAFSHRKQRVRTPVLSFIYRSHNVMVHCLLPV